MVMIKGVALSSTLNYNKEIFGEETFSKLISLLSEEDRHILTHTILDAGWYPLDAFVHYLEILTREILKGNEKALENGTGAVVEKQFNGVYKSLLLLGSPEALIEKIDIITNRYFQGIQVETQKIEDNKYKIKYTGHDQGQRLYEFVNMGWWRTAIKLMGATNINIQLETSIADEKGYFEVLVTWE